MFKALIVERNEDKSVSVSHEEIESDRLPDDGEVDIAVEYSTVNYKDGLCLNGLGGLVRTYPHVPGVDFAGEVICSSDDRYAVGDKVIMHGWRGGEARWGGYAQRANEKADWLVPLPDGLTTKEAMSIGTAGFTAMQAIMRLESHGMKPEDGEVLVTGAGGGVGSVATILLSRRGYQVAAATGRAEIAEYLTGLGASRIVSREELLEDSGRVLESSQWAGCIDSVGGQILARVLKQMNYGASVAAIGNAAGAEFTATVIPFLLRGINLLGIDSVACPYEDRVKIWAALAAEMPKDVIAAITDEIALGDVPAVGKQILEGQVKGRVVVDVNR